jgi:hypothetical protein
MRIGKEWSSSLGVDRWADNLSRQKVACYEMPQKASRGDYQLLKDSEPGI